VVNILIRSRARAGRVKVGPNCAAGRESMSRNWPRPRLFGLAAGAFLLILSGRYCAAHYVDFPVYWYATQSLLNGRHDLYSQNFVWGSDSWMTYRYPPLFLLLFVPLGMLPYMTAGFIWFVLKFAALMVTLRLLYKMSEAEPRKKRLFWLLPFLIATPYMAEEFRYGNVHFFIVFLTILALYLFETGKQVSSSMALALSISIKVFPVFFLPYFCIRKKFRYVVLTLGFVFAFNLLPGFYFGFDENFRLLFSWYDRVIRNRELHEFNSGINQSLKGVLQRYLSHIPYEDRLTDRAYLNINVANLAPDSVQAIWHVSTAIILALIALFCLFHRKQEDRPNRLLVYGLIACAILAFAPSTGYNYMVLLLVPSAAISAHLMGHYQERRTRVVVVLVSVAVALTVIPPLIPGRVVQRQMQIYSPYFFSTLALMLGSIAALIRQGRGSSQEAVPLKSAANVYEREDHS
jgi:hypothetical protein